MSDVDFSKLTEHLRNLATTGQHHRTMTRRGDNRFQHVCSLAAQIARAIDEDELARDLEIEVLRCHHCQHAGATVSR